VKKNAQIPLVVVGMVILFSSAQSTTDYAVFSKQTTLSAQISVAKSDFSQMHRSRADLIKNAESFARIDLDRSRFETEHKHCTLIGDALCVICGKTAGCVMVALFF